MLLLTLGLGMVLFVWRLGSTGLEDETPPLFAAAARAMAETGDWLIPRVNGLPRYDKPPLVYWAMGLVYALPAQELWDPLGAWAAKLPSALASLAVMLGLSQTLLRWPQRQASQAATALAAALAFGLSPLVLVWSRIAVSDALFSGCLAWTLLLCWRAYADPQGRWWCPWPVLALAVLAKGPVALLLVALALVLFGWLQADLPQLWRRLRPLPGLLITALLALPWYGAALLVEGEPFWRSFFGYHNLQRFSAVVNHHLQPWWYFGPVLLVAALPFSPLLLLGLAQGIGGLRRRWLPAPPLAPQASLQRFAACWLLAVLLFFTAAATKLPSYWLPATPAAGLLVALAAQGQREAPQRFWPLAWRASLLLLALPAAALAAGPFWLPAVQSPEMPGLALALLSLPWVPLGAVVLGLAVLLGAVAAGRRGPLAGMLTAQLGLVAFVPLVLLPLAALGDRLRAEPVRRLAAVVAAQARPGEPLAMVGLLKPSLHYYSRRVVIFEAAEPVGAVNLADRLSRERRPGLTPRPAAAGDTLLLVIDTGTASQSSWRGLKPELLALARPYALLRVDRARLERRAAELRAGGIGPDWDQPRPERY